MNKYYYGNLVSAYGIEHGYVDYRTFAKAFECVLNNSLMGVLENQDYYFEPYNLFTDNQEEIEEVEEEIEELEDKLENLQEQDYFSKDIEEELIEKIEELDAKKSALEEEQDYTPEIYQYYIVPTNAMNILDENNEIYFYCEELGLCFWGVTHFGTGWDYVLTDIKL